MDKLLVALDVETADQALELSDQLRDVVGGFKIGSRLFTAEGPSVVRKMVERGDRVFLDLKYHDIPSIVASAVRTASDMGVWMLTVHAAGGYDMLRAAKEAVASQVSGPQIVAVTVLTSFNDTGLQQLGITKTIPDQVDALAVLALEAGVDGVVVSPLEILRIRARCGPHFTVVVPGIRNRTEKMPASDDQKRTLTAAEALHSGADYLIVGRPIIAAADPRAMAIQMCHRIEEG